MKFGKYIGKCKVLRPGEDAFTDCDLFFSMGEPENGNEKQIHCAKEKDEIFHPSQLHQYLDKDALLRSGTHPSGPWSSLSSLRQKLALARGSYFSKPPESWDE